MWHLTIEVISLRRGGVQLDLGVLPSRVPTGILVLLVLQDLVGYPAEYFLDPFAVRELPSPGLVELRDDVGELLCSSRVGGEGLTLTEANHAVFINEWWGPSTNAQARDRVVRLGQEL